MSQDKDIPKLQAVKGMNDLLPPESAKWARVESAARITFERHAYREVRTPVVEHTPLYVRSIGEATDVVEKEMYTFADRDQRSLTLRPEGTAGVVRALLEHSILSRDPVVRWYYSGPMFRHERAQRGRYRQFYQMGVEAFGVAEPTLDAEQIAMLVRLFSELGISPLEAVLNSVGGPEDRPRYRSALASYLEPLRDALCPDCQRRVTTNVLRVLDCKNPPCQSAVAAAPTITDYLSDASRAHFDHTCAALAALGVSATVDPRLVRGLDYYTGTIFEVRTPSGDLGAQNTLGGGGRYDGLVADLGGPATPAVGFAFGVERVVLALPGEPASFETGLQVFFAAHGDEARLSCLQKAQDLRIRGFTAEVEHRHTSMKSQLKRADKLGARVVVVVGEEELRSAQVVVRDMSAGEQRTVSQSELASELERILGSHAG